MKKTKAVRGVAEKRVTDKLLANVPEGYIFFCNDGRIFRNMEELDNGLNAMSDETFSYHSNCDKHDFSNWVKDVIGDEDLASDLANAATRTDAAIIVSTRIEALKTKLV